MATDLKTQIAETLRQKILNGDYDERFPSERALMRRFGISRSAVRQILSSLEKQHIICRRQGSGTFLAERALSFASNTFGVIVPGTGEKNIAAMMNGLVEAAKSHKGGGFSVITSNLAPRGKMLPVMALKLAKLCIDERAIGVFLRPLPGDSGRKTTEQIISQMREAKIPVVLLDVDAAKLPQKTGCDLTGAKGYSRLTVKLAALLGNIAFRLMLQRLEHPDHPPAEVLLDQPYQVV